MDVGPVHRKRELMAWPPLRLPRCFATKGGRRVWGGRRNNNSRVNDPRVASQGVDSSINHPKASRFTADPDDR